jgi:hypothetical protein
MLNSTILDVAIGLIFVYLLLSLISSAANELLELALKKRAIDLERGIRELLVPGSPSGTDDLVARLYNHPLINGLFGGRYEDSRIASKLRYIWRTHLPAYIPSRSFALALMDLVLPGSAGGTPPDSTLSGAAGAAPPTYEVKLDAPPPPPAATATGALADLRAAIGSNTLIASAPQAQQALITLIDAAQNDPAKARQNIEDWFNTSMDRVSGWYKRRSQIFILILGLIVVILLNADTVDIFKALNNDKSLRETVVAAAIKASDQGATATSITCGPCAKDKNSADCKSTACGKDPKSPECQLEQNRCQLQDLGVPLGWSGDDPRRRWQGWGDFFKAQLGNHLLGWLLTAFAVSLGAPFWFDLLNKFIVVRSTVKPKEKSPDEKSKD